MEDKIYDIITDLLRDDITKELAIAEIEKVCIIAKGDGYKEAIQDTKNVFNKVYKTKW